MINNNRRSTTLLCFFCKFSDRQNT